jgi:sugar lactone lactonase YvrE
MATPRRIADTVDTLGESPVWCPADQALWWVDIEAPAVRRWNWRAGTTQSWPMPEAVGSLALRENGGLLVALRRGLAFFDPATGALTPAAPPHGGDLRFNDGRCDRQGRFWAGTMGDPARPPRGVLWRLDPVGGPSAVLDRLAIPNGLCWSPDGRTMYFADSPTRTIWAFPHDPDTGALGERRVFAEIDLPGVPDGATVDAEGHVWSAEWGAGRVTRYAPSGHVVRRLAVPVTQPTSCAFGGPALSTLFVTTARTGLPTQVLAAEPLAGTVLAFDIGVAGLPEPRYRG